jgi:hypothetical protein
MAYFFEYKILFEKESAKKSKIWKPLIRRATRQASRWAGTIVLRTRNF